MKKTEFFVAGNSKSGTTALYHYLRQHPQICMSEPKEPNYFAKDLLHDVAIGAFRRKSLHEYNAMFADTGGARLRGDASGCYLYSKDAIRQIYEFNPDAKIIIMFREPVDFLWSYHLQMLKNPVSEGETEKDFARALSLEEDRKVGRHLPRGCLVPQLLFYSERVKYAEHLERVRNYFSDDQVKIIIYDDFKRCNSEVVKDVFGFLDVDDRVVLRLGQYNEGARLRSKTMQVLVQDITHGQSGFGWLKASVKGVMPQAVRRRLVRSIFRIFVFARKDPVDPQLREVLQNRFKGEVVRLGQMLGRDLVREWQYT